MVIEPGVSTGSVQLQFLNSSTTEIKGILLTASDFVSDTTRRPLGAKVTFAKEGESAGKPTLEHAALASGQSLMVRLDVANLWESGEAAVALHNHAEKVGTLKAMKYRLPFNVKVDSAATGVPEITFLKGETKKIVLKNDDPVTYVVSWQLSAAGASYDGRGQITIPPNGTRAITVDPGVWFSPWYSRLIRFRWFTSLFKDEILDGLLTLNFQSPGSPDSTTWPGKEVPVKAKLQPWSEFGRGVGSNVAIIVLLVFGAFLSFLFHIGLPNQSQRADLHEDLRNLGRRISGVSRRVDSRLRLLVAVERARLSSTLTSGLVISPDMTNVFARCSQAKSKLERQIQILENVDRDHDWIEKLAGEQCLPTTIKRIEMAIWKAAEFVHRYSPSEEDLAAAEKQLADVNKLLEAAGTISAELKKELLDRASELDTALKQFTEDDDKRIKERFRYLLDIVTQYLVERGKTPAVEPTPYQIMELDQASLRLEILRDYLRCYHSSGDKQQKAIKEHEEDLFTVLGRNSREALRAASRLVRQMQEGIYVADLMSAKPESVSIEVEPQQVRAIEMTRFSLRFEDPQLHDAAAREDLAFFWKFGDELSERGSAVSHYFANPVGYKIEVTCRAPDGAERKLEHHVAVKPGEKTWLPDRNKAELQKLGIALVPALFAMVAGARDQFMKMDLAAGLLTTVAFGFTSDTVKNLMAPKAAAAAPAAQPAQPAKPPPAAGSPPEEAKPKAKVAGA